MLKVDTMLKELLKTDKLINFGNHFNIRFENWQGMSDVEIAQKLDEFSKLTDDLDLNKDSMIEGLALRPFGDVAHKENILQVYESFCKKRLAFDMGSIALLRLHI